MQSPHMADTGASLLLKTWALSRAPCWRGAMEMPKVEGAQVGTG